MSAGTILGPGERAFLASARTATLATIAPVGRARLVPICFVVDGGDAGGTPRLYSPIDEKPKRSADPLSLARVRDIVERPAVTLLVDRWSEDWRRLAWVRVDANADLLDAPGGRSAERDLAIDALRVKYPQYREHRLEDRPILRFTVERVVSWGNLDPD